MDKIALRKLIIDIGYLFNKHTDNKDIDMSKLMDDLNKTESYKPLQIIIKEHKELKKSFKIIADLMGYDKNNLDNTTLTHLFNDIAELKANSKRNNLNLDEHNINEEYD